jgi:hypothetical protein
MVNQALKFVKYNSPAILEAASLASLVAIPIFAIKATPAALEAMDDNFTEEELKELGPNQSDRMRSIGLPTYLKLTWREYVPTGLITAISAASSLGGSTVLGKRLKAVEGVLSVTEGNLSKYKTKVKEKLGEAKAEEIRTDIMDDVIKENPPSAANQVAYLGMGNEQLCYDAFSGRYFYSTREKMQAAINEVNRQMLDCMTMCVNDLYYELGLPDIRAGYDVGWNIDHGLLETQFSAHLTPAGEPAIALEFLVEPKYQFNR